MINRKLWMCIFFASLMLLEQTVYAGDKFMDLSEFGKNTKEALAKARVLSESQGHTKGGVAIIAKNTFVVVNSTINEIIMPNQVHWKGKNKQEKELVIIFKEKVYAQNQLPDDFLLSQSIIVSFESDKIRDFNFSTFEGSIYERK